MDIMQEQVGRVWVVSARGRLDSVSSRVFAQQLEPLVAGFEPRLLVDLSGVDFVSSAGLRAVLGLAKKIKTGKGAFALCGVQPPVHEVLDITGFTHMLDIHLDRRAALAALS
jgi:anti-anti-sigma factor